MSGWGQYPDTPYGRQQGGSQQTYGTPAQQTYGTSSQQQVNAYAGYGGNQGGGYTDSQGVAGVQASGYGQSGYGQSQPSSGAMQSGFGGQQQAGYGYGQQSGQGGAVAQAAQGLPPDQQARVSQMMAQMGGSGGQQTYGSASYQGATHPSAAASYNAGASQSAYGMTQPAAQTYPQGQAGTYATQQSPSTVQQGYGNTVQTSQQGYNSSSYGASQQGSSGYAQQQQQQQPSAYSAQAGYQAPQQANAPSTYVAQQTGQAYGQVPATPQAYSTQTSQAPHAAQQLAYSHQGAHGVQQTGPPQQSGYGQQGTARSYQAPYAQQYGANQHPSQQAPAAAQTPAAPLARPQQLPAPGTHSKASYNRPVTQARPAAATPAATPAFGRPTVQAPAGSRNAGSGRPVVIPPASSKHAAATAPAGRQGAAASKAGANSRNASAASNARGARTPAVGQSAREIARLADSMRDSREEPRVRERGLDADKERAKERPTAVPVRVTPSRERERERDREPARPKRHGPAPKSPPPLRRREPDYAVKLSTRPVTALERDYNDVIDRYPRLYVSADFAKIIFAWVQAEKHPGEKSLWPLYKPVSFQHEMDFELTEAPVTSSQAPVTPSQAVGVKWNARVMLLQGLADTAAKEWKKGTHHGGQHLHQLLKFLTIRHEVDNAVKGRMERSGIMAVGGEHDAALDGPLDGDPRTSKALMNTCIRHACDKLSIDLRPCLQWLCFLEVHYQRPAVSVKPPAMETSEVTIIFMADISTAFDKDWSTAWEAQQSWLKQKEEHDAAEAKKAKEAEEKKDEELKAAEAAKAAQAETAKAKPASAAAEKQDSKAGEAPGPLSDAPAAVAEPEKEESQKTAEDRVTRADEKGNAVPTMDDGKPKDAASELGATDNKTAGEAAKEADAGEKNGAMPDVPRLLIRGKRSASDRWRSASVSLDGLLDYDEEDRDEQTLELSLFAEAFQEMLAQHFGSRILEALYTERDAALHRREDRKRKRDEEKAAEKDKEKLKKIKEETEKQEPAAQLNGTRADVAKEDTPGQAQVKTEHIKEEPASAAVSEAAVIPNGDKAGHEEGKEAMKVDGDTVNDVGKEPKPVESMPSSTVERDEARTGEVLAGKPAVCDEASKMEVDTAAASAQAIVKSAADTAMEVDAAPKAGAAGQLAAEKAHEEGDKSEGSDKVAAAAAAEGAVKGGRQGDTTGEKTEKEAEKPKERPKKKYKVDEELLQAFRYFDRNCTGYLRVDDLRRIINNLGLSLSLRTVKELCLNVAGGSLSSKTRSDRVYYRDVTDKEVS